AESRRTIPERAVTRSSENQSHHSRRLSRCRSESIRLHRECKILRGTISLRTACPTRPGNSTGAKVSTRTTDTPVRKFRASGAESRFGDLGERRASNFERGAKSMQDPQASPHYNATSHPVEMEVAP